MTVVVVTYRSAGTIEECLASLRTAADEAGLPVRLVVVDNRSEDDSVERVRRTAPEALVIERAENDGFGRGCAAGAAATDSDILMFVNPDAVIRPDALSAMVREVNEHPDVAVLGGKQLREDGSVDRRSWWYAPTWRSTLCFATGLSSAFPGRSWSDPENAGRWDGLSRDVGAVSGGFMLVPRWAWDRLGGFDRDILLYGEDLDLCLRARRAGYRVRVCGDAVFSHEVGASSRAGGAEEARYGEALRLQLVLRGRATALRRHLGATAVLLLQIGVGLRALRAPSGRRVADGRTSTARDAWLSAWRSRRTWRQGWREGAELARVLDEARAAVRPLATARSAAPGPRNDR